MHLVLNSKFCCSTSKAMYSRTPANGHASKTARAGNTANLHGPEIYLFIMLIIYVQ